tara:strand:- start:186 stop:584 length:399 start_codon:yes stop_codon:yes gene_type:complete
MARKPPSQRFLPNQSKQGIGKDSDGGGVSDRREEQQGTNPANKDDDMPRGGGRKVGSMPSINIRAEKPPKGMKPKKGIKRRDPIGAEIEIGGVPEFKSPGGSPSTVKWGDVFTKDPMRTKGRAALLKSVKGG